MLASHSFIYHSLSLSHSFSCHLFCARPPGHDGEEDHLYDFIVWDGYGRVVKRQMYIQFIFINSNDSIQIRDINKILGTSQLHRGGGDDCINCSLQLLFLAFLFSPFLDFKFLRRSKNKSLIFPLLSLAGVLYSFSFFVF